MTINAVVDHRSVVFTGAVSSLPTSNCSYQTRSRGSKYAKNVFAAEHFLVYLELMERVWWLMSKYFSEN